MRNTVRHSPTLPFALVAIGAVFSSACSGTAVLGSSTTIASGKVFTSAPVAAAAVTLTDASTPGQVREVATSGDGSFQVDLAGLTGPYVLAATFSEGGTTRTLYAIAASGVNVDVTPVTDLAAAYAADGAAADALAASARRDASTAATALLTDLAAEAAPLLLQYGVSNLLTDAVPVRTMLQDVAVASAGNVVTFSNRRTGGTIHRVPIGNPSGGAYDPSQMPSGSSGGGSSSGAGGAPGGSSTSNLPANHPSIPSGASCTSCHGSRGGSSSGGTPSTPSGSSSSGGMSSSSGGSSGGTTGSSSGASTTDGAALYAQKCAICHGALASSSKRGAAASQILSKHSNLVTSAEASAIASALSGSSSSSSGGTASSSSGGMPPAPPGTSSSSGGMPPTPPGPSSSSGGSTSSSSSGGSVSTSGGTACGYGSNTAALAVTSGSKSATAGSYVATSQDESGVCAANSGSVLTLTNPTITTSGDTSSQDNSSFYGQNAAALAYTGSSLSLSGGTISTTGTGANGVFAYGTGAALVSGTTIEAKAQGGHGVMTAGGGSLVAENVTATTWGQNGSVIATDRGTGNKITVTGGTFTAHGLRSAGVYSTGDVTVSNATLTAAAAEGVVIEGKNSTTLNGCKVSATNASEGRGMMVYQSFSGDASVGQGTLTLNGGSYTWNSSSATSAAFYCTNTTAVIVLNGVSITNPTGYLLHAAADSWGTSGSNGGLVTFKATAQTLRGDMVIDAVSTLAASFTSSSSYTGAIDAAGTGKQVSVALDASSLWTTTATSHVHTLTGVVLSGSTVTNIAGGSSANVCYRTSFTDSAGTVHTSGTYALQNGGSLKPC